MIRHHSRLGLVPSSAGDGTPYTLIACHDTEGGEGAQGAWDTLAWMHATAELRNASYHELWGWDDPDLTIIQCVEPWRAAHSIAPQKVSASSGLPLYQPDAWVLQHLSRAGNADDPNQGSYAVAIAGTTATCARLATNPRFLEQAGHRFAQLAKRTGANARAEHFRYNPRTRSDWGRVLMAALGGLVTPTLENPPVALPIDVRSDNPFRGDIEWAIRNGLIVGGSDGKWRPKDGLPREQAAALLHRLAGWIEEQHKGWR